MYRFPKGQDNNVRVERGSLVGTVIPKLGQEMKDEVKQRGSPLENYCQEEHKIQLSQV